MFVAVLAGCSGLKQIQDTITKFDQGAHSVSTAEMNFFRAVQAADCTNQFYTKAFSYATDHGDFDLTGTCTPKILDDNQIQIRQALMDAITLYADKIVIVATSDDNKTLDSNSQKLAGNLNSFAKQQGIFSSLQIASGVEAAITAIADMEIDQLRLNDIKAAASSMDKNLQNLVKSLKAENISFATGIASKMDGIEGELRGIVTVNHKNRGTMSLFDVVEARRIMQSVNPFSPAPIAASKGGGDPKSDPQNIARQLNASLDAVVNANNAIANAGTGGIIAAVTDLVARAQAAQSIQSALNK
jgi:hypothetical protein